MPVYDFLTRKKNGQRKLIARIPETFQGSLFSYFPLSGSLIQAHIF